VREAGKNAQRGVSGIKTGAGDPVSGKKGDGGGAFREGEDSRRRPAWLY